MTQKADQLIAALGFEKELTPTKNQLAASEQQQQQVTQDVGQAAEDVARASRHERRLNNQAAADPLQNAADGIQQVAKNESSNAGQQLKAATGEAEQAETANAANPQVNPPKVNGQSLQAQQSLQNAETAIAQQAAQLSAVVDPLLAASEAARLQEEMGAGEMSDPSAQAADANAAAPANAATPANGDAQANAQAQAAAASANPASGSQPPLAGQTSAAGASPAEPPTADQLARAQQLARTLDELDRMQSAAASAAQALQPGQQPQPSTPTSQPQLDTLAQAARSQQAAQMASRNRARQEAVMALGEGGLQSSDSSTNQTSVAEFEVMPVNRAESTQWGKLRSQSAEDLTRGRTETVSEEYRKSVETYFKVLAERARKK